jgi:mono/diheme cytochrome c family protein
LRERALPSLTEIRTMSIPRIICLSAGLLFVACSGQLEDPIEEFQAPNVKSGGQSGGEGGTGGGDIIPPGGGGTGAGGIGGTGGTVVGGSGGGGSSGGGAGSIGDVAAGATVYASSCGLCHGDAGEGKDGLGSSLVATLPGLTREQVVDVIANGRPGTVMAAFSPSLDDQQIQDVTEYIIVTFGM